MTGEAVLLDQERLVQLPGISGVVVSVTSAFGGWDGWLSV
jgi:hypothetical protein